MTTPDMGDDTWCDAVSSQVATNASELLGDEAWYDAMSSIVATNDSVLLMYLAASPPTKVVAPDPFTSTVLGSQYHVWQCQGDGNYF